jgi:integrase
MIGKITKSTVERLGQGEVLWDTSLVGFGARRQLRHVHYLLRYRLHGQQKFISIGRHGMWTPDTARTEAKRLLGLVAQKSDPASERIRPTETFGAEVERYLTSKSTALKARSIREIHRYLTVHAKPLHSLPLTKIDRRTIAVRLGEVEQRSGGSTRNRFRSSLSAFFAWAIREGLTEVNPVTGTGMANEGNGRDRVLIEPELAALLAALGDDDFSDIVRLLVLTGQRREEIGGLKWSEIDRSVGQEMIVLSPDRTKNKRQHELPLSRQALAIIQRHNFLLHSRIANRGIPGPQSDRSEFVFGRRFTAWSKSKANLDQRLNGVAKFRLHDIRRSVATHMAELGILPHIIEAVLNHVSGHKSGVAGIYNRARYHGDMRAALQTWADYVGKLAGVGSDHA